MTTEVTAQSDGTPRGGTVFDIGYQRYTGPREGRGRARLAVLKDGVRTALGFGRGGRAKVLPWFFIGIVVFIALVMALVAGAAVRLGGPEAVDQLPSHSDFYGIASMILFVFAAVVAPELLCRDRRDGVINLYLVRPLSGSDYIIARWAAFFIVMTAAAWLPQLVLLSGLALGDPAPGTYLRENWLDIPRFLAAQHAVAVHSADRSGFERDAHGGQVGAERRQGDLTARLGHVAGSAHHGLLPPAAHGNRDEAKLVARRVGSNARDVDDAPRKPASNTRASSTAARSP
jgi:hypothetical protein